MEEIYNYIKINEMISTSGQPTEEDFSKIKDEGFEVIFNLSSSNSEGKLENQGEIVSSLGLTQIHLPIDFEEPQLSDLMLFIKLLGNLEEKKVWIHCVKNYRVTAFMYVYHKYILRTPFEEIDLSMFDEWTPDENWRKLMKITLEELELA